MGFDCVLSEDAARSLFLFRHAIHFVAGFKFRGLRLVELVEVETELVLDPMCRDSTVRVDEQCLRNGVNDALAIFREWHVDADGPLDLTHLAENHFQHDAVNWIIRPVQQIGFHDGCGLAKSVNPTFALFQPIGIPRQVVVQNRREIALEIDALAQTVGTNEDTLLGAFHCIDALLTDIVRVFAGDNLQVDLGVLLL